MQETSRPGYLLRVLTTGTLEAGMVARLVDRPVSTMTVAEAARVVNRDRDDWPAVERLAALPELAPALRERLRSRLARRDGGEDRDRLFGN
jgi:MOSC domain-containing protein YiiM